MTFWRSCGMWTGLLLLVGGHLPGQTDAPGGRTLLERFEFHEPHMGTRFRIVLYAPDETVARKAAQAAFSRVRALDQALSDYREDSELMRLCQEAGKEPVRVSTDLFTVLARAQEASRWSQGAFDVTIGPLTRLWRRARRQRQLPSSQELHEARKLVGYEKVVLDPQRQTVHLTKAGMLLDLGGIAKGYAADAALAVLREHGIRSALVAAGGDIVVGEPPPHAAAWRIGIAPLDDPQRPPTRTLALVRAAVSTSGDAEQFVEIDGVRYSHILDPRTGLGLTGRRSVTVIAPDGTTSDSLATAVSVLPVAEGLKLADAVPGTAALILIHNGTEESVHASSRWPKEPLPEPSPSR
jgi:thiamine biosynthesis lipoprotein